MKQSIEWHKTGLKNMRIYLDRKRKDAALILLDIERIEKEVSFYEDQIIRAEEMGKDSFDPDKFGVKK